MVSLALPQNAFQHLLRASEMPIFIKVINGLLVIWLAWQLAGLSWLVLPAPTREESATVEPEPQIVQRKRVVSDGTQLAEVHLFGEAGKQPVVKATPLSAPETKLRLTLKGVFASDGEGLGRAIIADPKGKEDSYAVGDPLPGGAKLSEIYPDRIILERGGRFETLKLPKQQDASVARSVSHRSAVSAGAQNGQTRATAFNKYRSEIKQNPASFMNYVRATPERQGGKFIGFRLQEGKQPGAFQELGLEPGDIVKSINGVQIDEPAKGIKAMQALGEGESVSVTLLRGGQEVSLNLTLPTSTR